MKISDGELDHGVRSVVGLDLEQCNVTVGENGVLVKHHWDLEALRPGLLGRPKTREVLGVRERWHEVKRARRSIDALSP